MGKYKQGWRKSALLFKIHITLLYVCTIQNTFMSSIENIKYKVRNFDSNYLKYKLQNTINVTNRILRKCLKYQLQNISLSDISNKNYKIHFCSH